MNRIGSGVPPVGEGFCAGPHFLVTQPTTVPVRLTPGGPVPPQGSAA